MVLLTFVFRYDVAESEASTGLPSPQRLAFAGLLGSSLAGSRSQPTALTVEVEQVDGSQYGYNASLEGARVLSPWEGVSNTLMNPLSPLRYI